MVKRGIDKNVFFNFLRCDKLALYTENFIHLKDTNVHEGNSSVENDLLFKELAYNLTCDSEKGFSKKIIRNKQFKTIDGEIIQADIILKKPNENILAEIVCSSDVKDGPELTWLAYKYYLIKKTKYKIDKLYIIKVDKFYEKNGKFSEKILFVRDVTTKIKQLLPNIPPLIERIKKTLHQSILPEKQKGPFCLEPNPCPFRSHCWNDIPNENSVFEIEGMHSRTKFNLFWKDISTFEEIPRKNLDKRQHIQVKYGMRGVPYQKTDKLISWLNELDKQKIWFLDVGLTYPVSPMLEGTKPFTAIPFQFSLNYQFLERDNYTHYDYWGSILESEIFLKNLIDKLNLNKEAPIVVYNSNRIKKCLTNLAHWYPEYDIIVKEISKRIVDLREVFIECWYYDPKFKGSYNLNHIVPIMIPKISYNNLVIKTNTGVGDTYLKSLLKPSTFGIDDKKNLLEYCNLNSYALMEIVKFLRKKVNAEIPIVSAA